MRKTTNILFAVLYLFLTTGFTITIHFCGGVVSDISIMRSYDDKDPCGCDGSACEKPCCTDEVHTIKLTDSQKAEAKFVQNSFELIVAVFHAEDLLSHEYYKPQIINTNFSGDSSPPSLYLSNRTLLI